MTGEMENNVHRLYPRPAITCDSRDETGLNPDLFLHRVDRGVTGMRREMAEYISARAFSGDASEATVSYLPDPNNVNVAPRLTD